MSLLLFLVYKRKLCFHVDIFLLTNSVLIKNVCTTFNDESGITAEKWVFRQVELFFIFGPNFLTSLMISQSVTALLVCSILKNHQMCQKTKKSLVQL